MDKSQFDKQPMHIQRAIFENTRLISRVFNSEDGRKLLEFWGEKYVNKTLPVTASEAELREANAKRAFVIDIKQTLELNKHIRADKG